MAALAAAAVLACTPASAMVEGAVAEKRISAIPATSYGYMHGANVRDGTPGSELSADHVSGATDSLNFPVVNAIQTRYANGDTSPPLPSVPTATTRSWRS
jgi:hypothetical protein